MADSLPGGCACGAVRYVAAVESYDAYLCHCRMCQRATGSVSIAFVNLPKAAITWEGEPAWYQSSVIAQRPFCASCGTSLGFAYPDHEKMDLTVASFDDPSPFRPIAHFGAESLHEAWIDTSALRRDRADEYAKLIDRWAKAGGTPNA
jgi:hypothetical protein